MTYEQEFINQFEAEITRVPNGVQQKWCTSLFHTILLPALKPYLSGRDVVYIDRQEPSLHIVLLRDNNLDIHFEIYLDTGTVFYAVFAGTDMLESNEGTVKEMLESVIEAINPTPIY